MSNNLARSFEGGKKRIRKLIEDENRYRFLKRLIVAHAAGRCRLTPDESGFVYRILDEFDGEVPDIFAGDQNICDSLRARHGHATDHSYRIPASRSGRSATASSAGTVSPSRQAMSPLPPAPFNRPLKP